MGSCLLCGQALSPSYSLKALLWQRHFYADQICHFCARDFVQLDTAHICRQCGRFLPALGLCSDCQRGLKRHPDFPKNRAVFQYNDALHDYFQQYKRRGDYRLRHAFAGSLRALLASIVMPQLIVPIPTQARHWRERQFDPVTGLFGDLLSLAPRLSSYDIQWQQSQLNRAQRLAAPQRFYCPEQASGADSQKSILLVDDIYTTGTTIWQGAQALRKAGYTGTISSLTFAR